MWSRSIAALVVIGALVSVVLVSAGSLTTSTGGTNAGGTLLQAQWSQGCVNNVNLSASHVGLNQCDPQRDAGTAWYCRLSSSGGVGTARQMCYEDFNGCSCNANNGGRNDYWCRGTPEDNPCESCVVSCTPSCPEGYVCEGAVTGNCDNGICECDSVRCGDLTTDCSGGYCEYSDECDDTGTWVAGSHTMFSCNGNVCVGTNLPCDMTGTCARIVPPECSEPVFIGYARRTEPISHQNCMTRRGRYLYGVPRGDGTYQDCTLQGRVCGSGSRITIYTGGPFTDEVGAASGPIGVLCPGQFPGPQGWWNVMLRYRCASDSDCAPGPDPDPPEEGPCDNICDPVEDPGCYEPRDCLECCLLTEEVDCIGLCS